MEGSFEQSGNKYEWWAGAANPDADEDWCVHCRRGDWGVTEYLSSKPDQKRAESRAKALSTKVDHLQ